MGQQHVVLKVTPSSIYGKTAKIQAEFSERYPASVLEDALNEMIRTEFSTAQKGTWFMTCQKSRIHDACANCGIYFEN